MFSPHGQKEHRPVKPANGMDLELSESFWKQSIMKKKIWRKQDFIWEGDELSELEGTLDILDSGCAKGLNLEWCPWWFPRAWCWRWAWAAWETVLRLIGNVFPGDRNRKWEHVTCIPFPLSNSSSNTFYKWVNWDLNREGTFPRDISKRQWQSKSYILIRVHSFTYLFDKYLLSICFVTNILTFQSLTLMHIWV